MSSCGHCDQFQVKKSFYLLWDNVHRDTYTEKLIYLPKLLGIRFTRLVDQSTYWLLYGVVVRVAGTRQTMGHCLGKMLLDKACLQSWPRFAFRLTLLLPPPLHIPHFQGQSTCQNVPDHLKLLIVIHPIPSCQELGNLNLSCQGLSRLRNGIRST